MSVSSPSQVTQFTSFVSSFRTLQAEAFEAYITLLGKEVEDLYSQSRESVHVNDDDQLPPSISELNQIEKELQSQHKQDLTDRMTDNLTKVSLILKTMWEKDYPEAEIVGEEATEMLTRELKQAAEIVFKATPAKFSPCFVVIHRRLVSLSGTPLEEKKYWKWTGRIVPYLVQLEVLVWINFALQQLTNHYDAIKAFLISGGNASHKRRRDRNEDEAI